MYKRQVLIPNTSLALTRIPSNIPRHVAKTWRTCLIAFSIRAGPDLDPSMFCTEVSRPSVVVYLEEDTATLLVGHKVHPRNTLSDHYIAELLMFVGRPLRAEARQSGYESQSRTIH